MLRRLIKARDRNILWSQRRGSRYLFSHDKIREALLGRLIDFERRRELHRLTAEYLLDQTPVLSSDVAYHFDAADCPIQALPHALRCCANEGLADFEV